MKATDAMYKAALKTADYLGGKEDVYTRAHWYELGDDDVKAVVDAALSAAPPDDDAIQRVLEAAKKLVDINNTREPPSWNQGKAAWDGLESAVSALRAREGK